MYTRLKQKIIRRYSNQNLLFLSKCIEKTGGGRAGVRVLSSRADGISHSFASLNRERYFQHEKIKFVSPSGHVMFCLFYSTDEIPT